MYLYFIELYITVAGFLKSSESKQMLWVLKWCLAPRRLCGPSLDLRLYNVVIAEREVGLSLNLGWQFGLSWFPCDGWISEPPPPTTAGWRGLRRISIGSIQRFYE